jgi:DNA-binding MarR family transcriptional regulator
MKHAAMSPKTGEGVASTAGVRDRLYAALSILDHIERNAEQHSSGLATEERVLTILKKRRKRERFFSGSLFADPAWDMLLELYAAELGQRRMSVTDVCMGSGVPPTTALRWICTLEKNALVTRSVDPFDARRVFIRLSDKGLSSMSSYFAEIGRDC